MAKQVVKKVKLQAPAGKATPAPPLGPTLGQIGVNIGEFVNQFNDRTKDKMGDIIPVELTVYDDRSFDFVLKTPPASRLILKAAGIPKGSGNSPAKRAGKITDAQLAEIAETKMPDLNANDIDAAKKIVAGTARQMGIDII
jgi:large subunit ribosomal protein L11